MSIASPSSTLGATKSMMQHDAIGPLFRKRCTSVVQHVIVARLAIRFDRIRQRIEVLHDGQHPRRIEHIGAVAETSIHGVSIVGVGLGIGVGDLSFWRRRRIAVTIAPVDVVASAEKDMLYTGAALTRLMVVIADRVLVG